MKNHIRPLEVEFSRIKTGEVEFSRIKTGNIEVSCITVVDGAYRLDKVEPGHVCRGQIMSGSARQSVRDDNRGSEGEHDMNRLPVRDELRVDDFPPVDTVGQFRDAPGEVDGVHRSYAGRTQDFPGGLGERNETVFGHARHAIALLWDEIKRVTGL